MIHVNVWQKPLQYCKVISLQLIKNKWKKKKKLLPILLSKNVFLKDLGATFLSCDYQGR